MMKKKMPEPTAESPRRFAILGPKRGRDSTREWLQAGVYTKEQIDTFLNRPGHTKYVDKIVELCPVTTQQRKVTEVKEVIV
jgi:hypothetical protein